MPWSQGAYSPWLTANVRQINETQIPTAWINRIDHFGCIIDDPLARSSILDSSLDLDAYADSHNLWNNYVVATVVALRNAIECFFFQISTP